MAIKKIQSKRAHRNSNIIAIGQPAHSLPLTERSTQLSMHNEISIKWRQSERRLKSSRQQ